MSFNDTFLVLGDTGHEAMTVGNIYARLKETYCGNIGYQYMHLHSREETSWIQNRIETPTQSEFSKEERLIILDRLTWAHHFEVSSAESFLKILW
jgi:2-oxoglutarate dehydrogenase E1 component